MKTQLKKIFLFFTEHLEKAWSAFRHQAPSVLACFFSFALVFAGIYVTASRTMAIRRIRTELSRTISYLNQLGYDIAYDKIEFNAVFFFPLVDIENLQIYTLNKTDAWALQFKEIKAYPNMFGKKRIRFESTAGGQFVFNDFASQMTSSQTFLDITTSGDSFDELVFHAESINIKDFAKIKKIAFLLESLPQKTANVSVTTPAFESLFEVNDVDINGLVNYPLSSHLKLFYTKAEIIGRPVPEDDLLTSLETWLKQGGFVEVPSLIVQWQPLTLVGRGTVNFSETFSPRVNFKTSSKGILHLIKDLQDNAYLDSKNVFVANILLTNKAFKLNPDDDELTISTPISYADGKLSIENLTLKDFTK